MKEFYAKTSKNSEWEDKIDVNGIKVSKKLLNKDNNRSCPVCQTYSFDTRNNVYMTKYTCCRSCFINHVEGREDRWATGWRPTQGEK